MILADADLTAIHLAMGAFALFVVVVSLVRIMAEEEYPPLTATKKFWGRRRGLLLHFLSHVGVPLVFGVIFLTRGAAGPDLGTAARHYDAVPQVHIVQHLLLLKQQATQILSEAAIVIETELELYQPWFAPSPQILAASILPAASPEPLRLWYQAIP